MRLFIAAAVAASLFATNLLAAETATPLSAGKPAGVKEAQGADNTIWYVLGTVAVVGIAVAAASGVTNSTPATTPPTTS